MPERSKLLRFLACRHRGSTTDYPIQAMQRSLAAQGVPGVRNDAEPVNFLGNLLRRARLIRNFGFLSRHAYFVPIMQISEQRLFPQCYWSESIVYCFDCWPAAYDRWEAFFRRQRIKVAFISARQSADRVRERVPGLDAIWMPEGIELDRYVPDRPLRDRTIDVLEMGRRWDDYHERIREPLAVRGRAHRYEKLKGQWVFATEDDFYQGLADTKVSICFPSSLTHPQRSGDVETMTLRYLESFACRSIVVGRCPAELADLFGYNPLIEADPVDPAGQLEQILGDVSGYEALVDRNLARLREVGTWDTRVGTMLQLLRERGYFARNAASQRVGAE